MPNASPKKNYPSLNSTKEGGYKNQKRYAERHPERVREQARQRSIKRRAMYYEPKLRILHANKPHLDKLLEKTGLTLSQLCFDAIQEKYGINLGEPIDKSEE